MSIKDIFIKPFSEIEYRKYASGRRRSPLTVHGLDETIDMLIATENSLVRFGDGEIRLIEGDSLPLQPASPELAEALAKALTDRIEGLEAAIPDIFESLEMYRPESRDFWKKHLVFFRKKYEEHCLADREYYDAFFSRLHYMYNNRDLSRERFGRIRQIWADRDVLVIESKSAHTGVDNDLLGMCKSIRRIIGPESDTWSAVDRIHDLAAGYPKDTMILISAGPAAKPLTYALVRDGFRVIDIGSLDMEYQWYCMGVCEKCHPTKKNCLTIEDDRRAGYTAYIEQIDKIVSK